MTCEERLQLAINTLREEVDQLQAWAEESRHGGWSTHQVGPQRARADKLKIIVYQLEGPSEVNDGCQGIEARS